MRNSTIENGMCVWGSETGPRFPVAITSSKLAPRANVNIMNSDVSITHSVMTAFQVNDGFGSQPAVVKLLGVEVENGVGINSARALPSSIEIFHSKVGSVYFNPAVADISCTASTVGGVYRDEGCQ